jgi:hypothetical protein
MHQIDVLNEGQSSIGSDLLTSSIGNQSTGNLLLNLISHLVDKGFGSFSLDALIEASLWCDGSQSRDQPCKKLVAVELAKHPIRVVPPTNRPTRLHPCVSVDRTRDQPSELIRIASQ